MREIPILEKKKLRVKVFRKQQRRMSARNAGFLHFIDQLPSYYTLIICDDAFRKPWLRVKSVKFNFSARSSSTDYNESSKPTPKSLAQIGSEKSLIELGVPQNALFHFFTFFALLKSLLFILNHG